MGTAAPNGQYWSQYCHGEPELSSGNFIVGPWGECLAWAVVYEHQNQWENDPDYRHLGNPETPCSSLFSFFALFQ